MAGVEDIKRRIINRLVRWRKWGGAHTENIIGGMPSHLIGSKATKEAIRELERLQWIIPAKKTREIHYSLNPEKAGEILQYYEKSAKDRDA